MKEEQMDTEKENEFASMKILKVKPGFSWNYLSSFGKKQKVSIVIKLDGFYKISLSTKCVVDLLQALRQTEVEQVWISTQLI